MPTPHELDRMVRLVRDVVPDDVSDEQIIRRFQTFRICCVADAANLSTHAGQTALVTFVLLATRMGVQVDLIIPEVKIIGSQPPLRGTWLKAALIDIGKDLIPASWIRGKVASCPDLTFVFGDTPYVSLNVPAWRLSGSGSEWAGRISDASVIANRWTEVWPIGAMTAATLASAEVFKAVARQMRPAYEATPSPYLEVVQQAMWDWGSDCLGMRELDCGFFDLVSAGAINQAAMYALLRVPGLRFSSRIFDADIGDGTNLNRGMLMRYSDIGLGKVSIIARYSLSQAIPDRLDRGSLLRYGPLAPAVLVGVDNIPTRWEIQKACWGWLGIGGTSHFLTITSSHEIGDPCGGCLHFIDDPEDNAVIPTVSFVSFWAGLALTVRFLRHKLGRPYEHKKQALWLAALRMDDPNAGWWSPVAARKDCPVRCGMADISKTHIGILR